jgi:hypothetical protein
MVLVKERGKVLSAALLRFCMDVWLCTILLEGPIVPEHVIGELESNWEYFLDLSIMIDCSILENH